MKKNQKQSEQPVKKQTNNKQLQKNGSKNIQSKKEKIQEAILEYINTKMYGASISKINEYTGIHRQTLIKYLSQMEKQEIIVSHEIGPSKIWYPSSPHQILIKRIYRAIFFDYFKAFCSSLKKRIQTKQELHIQMQGVGQDIAGLFQEIFFDEEDLQLLVHNIHDQHTVETYFAQICKKGGLFGPSENIKVELIPLPPLKEASVLTYLFQIRIPNIFAEDGELLLYLNCGLYRKVFQNLEIPLRLSISSLNPEHETSYWKLEYISK
jgi:hypothetical protein